MGWETGLGPPLRTVVCCSGQLSQEPARVSDLGGAALPSVFLTIQRKQRPCPKTLSLFEYEKHSVLLPV